MADNLSTTSSASSATTTTTGPSSQSGRGKALVACRKRKQELRRERVNKAISLKRDDVTVENITNDTDRDTVNVLKDTLKVKYETDINKLTKLKDQELNKLRQDLTRCQLELREEVEKRGQSTSARSGFDLERRRLLGDLREMGEAKRRLEIALEAASTNIKRKTSEMREMQDMEKQKLAALEKSANSEIRKLLDELKNRDQQIKALQSSDKHNQSKTEKNIKSLPKKNHHHPSPQLAQEFPLELNFDNTGQIYPNLSSNITTQRRMYIMENQLQQWATANDYLTKRNKDFEEEKQHLEKSIEKLQIQNKQLKCDLEIIKIEAAKLNEMLSEKNILLIKDQIGSLQEKNQEQKLTIESWHEDGQVSASIIKKNSTGKVKPRKTLCFFLPGDTAPTPGGKVPMFIDQSTMTEPESFLKEQTQDIESNHDESILETNSKEEFDEYDKNNEVMTNNNNDYDINNDYVMKDDPSTHDVIKIEEDYYDEEMAEEHLQMEASFELMLQQEMMNKEQVQQELMQQEFLQQMQMQWHEEKENMCSELIQLKKKLNARIESDEINKKLCAEFEEKYENLEFKLLELEGDKNPIELKECESQTNGIDAVEVSTQSEMFDMNSLDGQPASYESKRQNADVISLNSEDDIFKMTSSSISSNTSGFAESATRAVDDAEDAHQWMDLCDDLEGKLRESRRKLRQVGDRAALVVAEKERRIRQLELLLQEDGVAENDNEKGILIEMNKSIVDWSETCRSPSVEMESMCFQRFWSISDDEEEQNERKISTLEKDCQSLREIVEVDESIIEGLQRQVQLARCSEEYLIQFIERLEAAEVEISERMISAEEENMALHREIEGLEKIDKMQRCTIAELRGREASANDRMSDMIAEFNSVEAGLKRRLSESQREIENIMKQKNELEDREEELASMVDLLRKKMNNMQMLIADYQQQLYERPPTSELTRAYMQNLEEEKNKNELLVESARRWQNDLVIVRSQLTAAREELAAAEMNNCRLSMQLEESVFVEAKLASQIQELKSSNVYHSGSQNSSQSRSASFNQSDSVEEANSLSEISELPEDEEQCSDDVIEECPHDVTENSASQIGRAESVESLNDSGIDSIGRKNNSERFLKPSRIPRNRRLLTRRLIPNKDADERTQPNNNKN